MQHYECPHPGGLIQIRVERIKDYYGDRDIEFSVWVDGNLAHTEFMRSEHLPERVGEVNATALLSVLKDNKYAFISGTGHTLSWGD